MIVDTSAIVALLRSEADADSYATALVGAGEPLISAGTYTETAIVVDSNRDPVLSGRLDDLLAVGRAKVEPVTQRQAWIARQAYRDFGEGSGHPAALNLRDCFAYALARDTGQPLLFKGDDFFRTDVISALGGTGTR